MFTHRRTAIVASVAALSLAAAPIAGAATFSSTHAPRAATSGTLHDSSPDRSRHDVSTDRRGDSHSDLSRLDRSSNSRDSSSSSQDSRDR